MKERIKSFLISLKTGAESDFSKCVALEIFGGDLMIQLLLLLLLLLLPPPSLSLSLFLLCPSIIFMAGYRIFKMTDTTRLNSNQTSFVSFISTVIMIITIYSYIYIYKVIGVFFRLNCCWRRIAAVLLLQKNQNKMKWK